MTVMHQATSKRDLNGSSSQPKWHLKSLRLTDGKPLGHSKNSNNKKLEEPSVGGIAR